MNCNVEYAIRQTEDSDLTPIRCRLGDDGYYHLRAANGDRRSIAAGSGHTVLANAGWPKKWKNPCLWIYAAATR